MRPEARSATAFAITVLIAVSSVGSDFSPSMSKKNQFELSRIAVGESKQA